ncbi:MULTISPECIES: CaiB/BaiF CoA-transferase family protein [unclassified Variovorax]|uniref:CaiB/BaiF CoA transferase family protein n=1 Tax=unclassified Variovorax TaxID=663243 RepID=UPI00076DA33D|nr:MULTISPECIES: CaiB/BaiF CoA-transferase family protein [unclassified Variovorax]KWT65703.1 Alpha-methylacyl-CoA racemase [Variovorax sp. WDL1]PNG56730.1 Acetyl-CoA:oxalate CoA-transferase [Variovorax sp. B4]PNG58154.1 Acetyl-CoA:oxalate CoA-transferase [Variovorax sp. B2]VTV09339.1 Formyl-coenzyme A transferase [Variovorax sp. WDL1]
MSRTAVPKANSTAAEGEGIPGSRATGPLGGLRIIEMAGLAPGPFAAMMLADMGATVLRIDRPDPAARAMPQRFYFTDRNRRSIAVDLKSSGGAALVKRLVAGADALIEGFRPGVMERLGLGPEPCLALNPKLVYGRMTGWGQEGPMAMAPGHDINYIALSGALEAIGNADGPPVVPLNLVGDFGGGGMYLAFGIACALIEAARSGKGQVVDAAMVDGAASLMTYFFGYRAGGAWPGRGRSVTGGGSPFYAVYETRDGKYISIGSAEPKFYAELLRQTGLENAGLPDRADPANWPAIRARLAEVFRTRTRGEWCAQLETSETCFAPVLSMEEAAAHPHNRARGTFVEVDGMVQPAPAPRFSRTPAALPAAGVEPGIDLHAALAGWGLELAEIDGLAAAGVVG